MIDVLLLRRWHSNRRPPATPRVLHEADGAQARRTSDMHTQRHLPRQAILGCRARAQQQQQQLVHGRNAYSCPILHRQSIVQPRLLESSSLFPCSPPLPLLLRPPWLPPSPPPPPSPLPLPFPSSLRIQSKRPRLPSSGLWGGPTNACRLAQNHPSPSLPRTARPRSPEGANQRRAVRVPRACVCGLFLKVSHEARACGII